MCACERAAIKKSPLKSHGPAQQTMRKFFLINTHADVSSEAIGLNLGLSFHLHLYFVYATRPRGFILELILRLKIKRSDWLLVDTCPQAANHCTLF